jgi:hypothetical protein
MTNKPLSLISFILTLAVLILVFSGSPAIEQASTHYLHQSLKKATISFAGARAINALVSVAQEVRTGGSLKLFGTGGSADIAPLAWLDPLNDLVERFSLIMLASCVSLGIQIFLNEAMPWLSLRALLPVSGCFLLIALVLKFTAQPAGKSFYRAGAKLLLATTLVLIMVPAMAAINHFSYKLFLADTYETASISLRKDTRDISAVKDQKDADMMDTLTYWTHQMSQLKNKVGNMINNILDIILVFIIQTMVLPLVVLWVFIRLITALLGKKGPLPFEDYFMPPGVPEDSPA